MSEVTIEIDDIPLQGFEALGIKRSLANLADGFSFSGPYDPDGDNARLLEPPEKKAVLRIDGEIYITGLTQSWDPGWETNSSAVELECRSLPGTLIECTSDIKSATYRNQTLKQIADSELQPFGIKAEFPDGDSAPIPLAQRCPLDKVFAFLKKYACNYGFVMNSTDTENLKFAIPGKNSPLVDSFSQGEQPLLGVDVSYDWSNRFSEYIATAQLPGNPTATATTVDESADFYRPLMFKADARTVADLQKSADLRLTQALTAMEVSATVAGWRNRENELWLENTLVELYAPKVFLFQSRNYLIKSVKLDKTEQGGEIAELTMVMPETYTGEIPEILPWLRE
jgi:prophage tail gpP-like protein